MTTQQEGALVVALNDAAATVELVGGKGASLARLAAADLPVPRGFSLTTAAYRRFVTEHGLQEQILAAVASASLDQPATCDAAAQRIATLFAEYPMPDEVAQTLREAYTRLGGGNLPVAVRSSATAEDLPDLSFAGQQETYLNMRGEAQILDAVKRCWASLWTARAISYRLRNHIAAAEVSLAVVVQELVPAEASGILFTANPVTNSSDQILINAAWGLGEALVGGLVTPDTLVLDKKSGAIITSEIHEKEVMTVRTATGTQEEPVPAEQRRQAVLSPTQATELGRLGVRVEELYGQPMDIEWTLLQGHFSLVQARPITTLRTQTMEVWNDSLDGNYLWTNGNLGEAVPDVMTPCSWSLIQIFMSEAMSPLFTPDFAVHHPIGNIGGRFYMNMSLTASMGAVVSGAKQAVAKTMEEVFGRIPDDLDVPLLPMTRWQVLATLLPASVRIVRRVNANKSKVPAFVAAAPTHCEELRSRIAATTTAEDLISLWRHEIEPFFRQASMMLEVGARSDSNSLVLFRRRLRKLVGEADANALLSGQSELESLGLLVGLERLERGEIDRATFARQYGHRGPHEFEVSLPRPGEDPHWIDEQLAGLRAAPVDVTTRLAREKATKDAAWQRFQQRHPRQVESMHRRLDKASVVFHLREQARSEVTRAFWVLRAFVVRAAELTGLGDDIFYLSIDEIVDVLAGEKAALRAIPARRTAYVRYRTLPPYPRLIVGHFDPFTWAADPNRNSNLFDARSSQVTTSEKVSGFAGATGIVEGRVRIIATPEEGNQLQAGEILVARVTNVGWTPLFPRAAAIVTDVGAPLSHAAIVARELGIPAVVGCGNATMRLYTGDWVCVNGEQGTVEILQAAPTHPITALPAESNALKPATAPETTPVVEWKLPDPKGNYMRSSVLELLPDPLSPLFATLGLPAWSRVTLETLQRAGLAGMFADEFLVTIHGYGYYNLTLTPARVARTLLVLPLIAVIFPRLLASSQARWHVARSRYAAVAEYWQARDLAATPALNLLGGVRALTDEAAEYYLTVQSGILPAAYMSEGLFTLVYNTLLKKRNAPSALTFLLGFDSEPIQAEQSLYDLAQWIREQPALASQLVGMSSEQFRTAYQQQAGAEDGAWSQFWQRLATHLARFGHAIYDLDFAKAVLADDPRPLLETLKFFLSGQAPDPSERRAAAAAAREEATQHALASLRGICLQLFQPLVQVAQGFAPLREDALADVGLGWPILRRMLHEIGRRLVTANSIDTPDDVFWLTLDEVQAAAAALDVGQAPVNSHAAIAERHAKWQRERALTPPVALPVGKGARFMGINFSGVMPARVEQPTGETLKGIAASPGRITGTARVITSPNEFDQMRQGEILVARITTPAWTPLFALAVGIVTDVGGPLSHSSIVAREYHIPAVLGTGAATERLRSGQRITVDGDAGTVEVSG